MIMTDIKKTALVVALACVIAPGVHGQSIAPAETCAALAGLQIPGTTMTITKAEAVPVAAPGTVRISPTSPATVAVALPSYCRAEGVVDQRVGVEGKSYGIGFAVALPDG
jgi:hypothetical protein